MLRQTVGVVSAKTAAIIVTYLVIAAGMVASRADTKRSRFLKSCSTGKSPGSVVAEAENEVVNFRSSFSRQKQQPAESSAGTSAVPLSVVKPAVTVIPDPPVPVPAASPEPDVTPSRNLQLQTVRPDWMG